jgi:hypothetical protein
VKYGVGVGVLVTGISTNRVTSEVTSWVTSNVLMTVATWKTGVGVTAGAQAATKITSMSPQMCPDLFRMGYAIRMAPS